MLRSAIVLGLLVAVAARLIHAWLTAGSRDAHPWSFRGPDDPHPWNEKPDERKHRDG